MSFFGLLPLRMWLAVAALTALFGAIGVQTLRLDHAKSALIAERGARATEHAQAEALALKTSETYRAREALLQSKVEDSQHAYDALQVSNAHRLAAALAQSRTAAADNDRLRGQLAAYAGGGGTDQDTVAAASHRAAALGELLAAALKLEDETLSAGAESTNAAESNADAVRTLLAAWPK